MKKALKIIKNILVWTVVAVAVFMMVFTVVSVTSFDRGDRDIFGYKMFIVKTDSMKATHFEAGDLIFVKEVKPETLQPGDVITFTSMNEENIGETVTHMIRKKTIDAQGVPGFITYGTTTNTDDDTVVTLNHVHGKYVGKIANVGVFFDFLKTPQGYIVCILVPFVLIIIYQGIVCVKLFRRYKKEQNAEIEEERAKLEAEREENRRMLEELQALRAQMMGDSEKQPDGETAPAEAAENDDKPEE
jgi:signal peptidase